MKLTGLLKTSVLISLLGASALIYAQDQKDEAKPEEPRPEATRPARDEAKPARSQDETKDPKQDQKQDQDGAKPARNEEKPANHENDHNAQRADERRGGHIPDDKFRAHFGRDHTVVINRPTIVEGHPRFQYGGYWFTIVDVWPAGWAYSDQCYIDYVDGEYFLFDLTHPGARVAIVVVM